MQPSPEKLGACRRLLEQQQFSAVLAWNRVPMVCCINKVQTEGCNNEDGEGGASLHDSVWHLCSDTETTQRDCCSSLHLRRRFVLHCTPPVGRQATARRNNTIEDYCSALRETSISWKSCGFFLHFPQSPSTLEFSIKRDCLTLLKGNENKKALQSPPKKRSLIYSRGTNNSKTVKLFQLFISKIRDAERETFDWDKFRRRNKTSSRSVTNTSERIDCPRNLRDSISLEENQNGFWCQWKVNKQ